MESLSCNSKGNYDVVNMHGYLYYYLIAICLLHNKTRFFYTVHSDARMENGRWDRKLFKLKRYFFKKGWIKPITISKESQRSFTDLYGVPSNLIYNGTSKPSVKPFLWINIVLHRIRKSYFILGE